LSQLENVDVLNSLDTQDSFLTVAEVAGLLKLNQQTVRNWIDQGSLPAVRVGRRVRIRRADLERILDEGYSAGGGASGHIPSGPSAEDFWGGEAVGTAEPPSATALPRPITHDPLGVTNPPADHSAADRADGRFAPHGDPTAGGSGLHGDPTGGAAVPHRNPAGGGAPPDDDPDGGTGSGPSTSHRDDDRR
jgi:excisionase family DNA binding protein